MCPDNAPTSEAIKITTVMAAYNCSSTISRAIESFASQSYAKKELIIVDGGSTDGTVGILERNADVISHWISEPDSGILDAWNKGINLASGDWVHFLGADDYYLGADVFERFAGHLAVNGNRSKILYGDVHLVDHRGTVIEVVGRPWDATFFRQVGMAFCHQGAFHHRSLFEEFGQFDTSRGGLGTYEFLLRYLKHHDADFMSELSVAAMGTDGLSNRPENHLTFQREYRRAQRVHGTARPNWRFTSNLLKAQVKRLLWRVLPTRLYRPAINVGRLLLQKPKRYHG